MRFLIKKALVAVLAALVISMIAGCSLFTDYKENTEKQGNITDQNQIIAENSITIGVVELDTYNPLTTKSPTAKNMLGFIYEPLFDFDSNQNTSGVLAQSYNIAPDGKSLVVKLKENVIWHDGGRFSSSDVIYTMQTILNTQTQYGDLLQNVTAVSAADDYSFVIEFDRSIPNPVALLTFPIIQKNAVFEGKKPIGTGPFYFDYDKLTAFKDYYGQKASIDTVFVKSIPDNEKFVSMFNASVIDVADSSMLNMTEYTPRSNATVNNYISNEMVFAGFNFKNPVFRHASARRSVCELIDRKNAVSHIYFSRAEIAHYPMNPANRFYPENTLSVNSNHGAAEKELKNGGWNKDNRGIYMYTDTKTATYFSVDILVNSEDTERVKIASELSETMTELGMKNTISMCSESEFLSRLNSRNYDMFIGKTTLLPNNDLHELLSGNNVLGYSDEQTDILLTQLGTLVSENDKREVYTQLFERIGEECPIGSICFLKESLVTSAKIKSGASASISGTVIQTWKWSVK